MESRGVHLGFVAAILLLVLQGSDALLKDGKYYFCGASAESAFSHTTGSIRGGVNMLHPKPRLPCENHNHRFRTFDGTCNALNDEGAAFGLTKRLCPHAFQGDNSEPRDLAVSGKPLPSAREVSLAVHVPKAADSKFTLLTMQIGQLLDHDMTIVPVATEFNKSIRCCNVPLEGRYHDCYPIEIPHYDKDFQHCQEFVRSDPLTHHNGTVFQPRRYLNALTAFLDASFLYGSDDEKAHELRANNGTGALMKTSVYNGEERLPMGHDEECVNVQSSHYCADAGDARVNEQPALTAIHTVFVKWHNHLVRKFVRLLFIRRGRPYDDDVINDYLLGEASPELQEEIFQIVRKIVGANWQNIVYREYLPLIIGPRLMSKFRLYPYSFYRYNPKVDPSISLEFLTAAFRYGHTLVNDMIYTDQMRPLRTLFSISQHCLDHYGKIVEGLVTGDNHSEPYDSHLAPSLTKHLFETSSDNGVGLDLASLNIQRGRDHGIPSHNDVREHLRLGRFTEWEQYGDCADALRNVYESVDDVDLFTGSTCERSVSGGIVGETFALILAIQFRDLKFGDRYWFETREEPFRFEYFDLASVRRVSLSKILCEGGTMKRIQRNPFMKPGRNNPVRKCSQYRDVNMWPFLDEIRGVTSSSH